MTTRSSQFLIFILTKDNKRLKALWRRISYGKTSDFINVIRSNEMHMSISDQLPLILSIVMFIEKWDVNSGSSQLSSISFQTRRTNYSFQNFFKASTLPFIIVEIQTNKKKQDDCSSRVTPTLKLAPAP